MRGSKRSIKASVVVVAVAMVTGQQCDALGGNHHSEERAVVDGNNLPVMDRDTAKQEIDDEYVVIDGKQVWIRSDEPPRVVVRNRNDKGNRLIQVAQESKPGKGDFDDNVLGYITPFQRKGTAEVYYGHTGPPGFTGPKPEIEADRSHLFFVDGLDGLSLFSVHGPPGKGETAEAVTRIEIRGDSDRVVRTVEDDPEQRPRSPDTYKTSWPLRFKAGYWWRNRNTDGQALTGFDGDWQAVMTFESVPSGFSEWVAYSAHGKKIPLELDEGRRVRLKASRRRE